MRQQRPSMYPIKTMSDGTLLICYRDNVADPNWRIVLPAILLNKDVIRWYHLILGHCGTTKLYDTIRARFAWKNLRTAPSAKPINVPINANDSNCLVKVMKSYHRHRDTSPSLLGMRSIATKVYYNNPIKKTTHDPKEVAALITLLDAFNGIDLLHWRRVTTRPLSLWCRIYIYIFSESTTQKKKMHSGRRG